MCNRQRKLRYSRIGKSELSKLSQLALLIVCIFCAWSRRQMEYIPLEERMGRVAGPNIHQAYYSKASKVMASRLLTWAERLRGVKYKCYHWRAPKWCISIMCLNVLLDSLCRKAIKIYVAGRLSSDRYSHHICR